MLKSTIHLAFPISIMAKIIIQVTLNNTEHNISYHGSDVDLISEMEKQTFKLSEDTLKVCAYNYFGEEGDVHLSRVTTWGDIYKIFNWTPVTRSVKPISTKILSLNSMTTAIRTQVYNNTSTLRAKFKMEIHQDTENKVYGSWVGAKQISVKDVIFRYNITTKIKPLMRVHFVSKWGQDFMKTEPVVVGSDTPFSVSLDPGKTIITDLMATQIVLKVKVGYLTSLFGSVVVNFPQTHKGHHFWAVDVQTFMDSCGLKGFFETVQVVVLNCYVDSQLVVRDAKKMQVLDRVGLEVFEKNGQ